MSVVLKDPNGKYILMCKGADSIIYEKMSSKS
jgi:magnesium-transporting ATPase (P-type)